jgi:hypothetical protein
MSTKPLQIRKRQKSRQDASGTKDASSKMALDGTQLLVASAGTA